MTFSDIFKSNFLENVTSVSPFDMVLAMALAFCMGLFIFFVYKKTYSGVMYSSSFGVTLVALTMITTLVILAVTSNVVLSLGMVGALSIVRFRTAVKDPMDLVFLFWSISVGIICGAGLVEVAIILSLAATAVIMVLDRIPVIKSPMILVVNSSENADTAIADAVKSNTNAFIEKSRVLANGSLELVYELRTKDSAALSKSISAIEGVSSVSVLSHDGEISF